MSRVGLDHARARLDEPLALAVDEEFLTMIWAAVLAQSGFGRIARQYLNYPKEVETEDIPNPHYLHRWRLETLVNELLITRKADLTRNRRKLDCHQWDSVVLSVNAVHALEEAEYAYYCEPEEIRRELERIIFQQFEWQRGHFHKNAFYRAVRLYSFDEADRYLLARHGVGAADLIRLGFLLFAQFCAQPTLRLDADLSSVGISSETSQAAFRLISVSNSQAKIDGRKLRKNSNRIAYAKSLLRRTPCIVFADGHMRCPIPQILAQRLTSGIYYDLVSAGGSIRRQIGENFEHYVGDLLTACLPEARVIEEYEYAKGLRTPDFLIERGAEIDCVIECKSKRMPFEAKFEDVAEPQAATQGHEELRKGVVQLWRYFSLVRRGEHGRPTQLRENSIGVVLMLDSWFEAGSTIPSKLMEEARQEVAGQDVIEADCRPIAFVAIDDLEDVVRAYELRVVLDALELKATPKYQTYHMAAIVRDALSATRQNKPYPFEREVNELIPWLKEMRG